MEVSSPHDNQFFMLRWAEEEEEREGRHFCFGFSAHLRGRRTDS